MTSTNPPTQTIDSKSASDIAELARKLDATHEQVEEAIRAVGSNASDIELHLKGSRSTTNAERTDEAGKR
ncbi:DUF3606 domain-containing protein [Variovorax sp. UC122_21]|mgnify:CR=1 FL=1|jgi:hypothetical protein|uniref:DUF3606 domain-containing protein n=1 Tax=Variovorax TaxID=34072 RepID=UPI001933F6AD|nr:DUF3606 domain-containing protein [Variovorax paradoxus]